VVMTSDPTVIVERANRMQKEVRQGGLKQKSGTSIGRKREHDSGTTGFTSVSIDTMFRCYLQ